MRSDWLISSAPSVSHGRVASSVEVLEVFVKQLEKLLPSEMSGEFNFCLH